MSRSAKCGIESAEISVRECGVYRTSFREVDPGTAHVACQLTGRGDGLTWNHLATFFGRR